MRTSTHVSILALVLGLCAAAETHAQTHAAARIHRAPTQLRAIPDYDTFEITLTWQENAHAEEEIQVFRSVAGGVPRFHAALPPNTTQFVDTAIAPDTEYVYRVRAVSPAGNSLYTPPVRQSLKTVWPVPASHEILHNWNETIGSAARDELDVATGFHMGVDIQRVGATSDVVATRGGVVVHADPGPDGAVVIRVRHGAGVKLYQANHLHALTVALNDVVYPGQKVGEISTTVFADPFDHTHFVLTNTAYQALQLHPLSIFSAGADRDPQGNAPGFIDHAGSPAGTVLYKRQGAGPGVYLTVDATHPLDGDVDILVELGDVMGGATDVVPTRLGYWIEQPPQTCGVTFNDVKRGDAPYLLFAWEEAYFGDDAAPLALSRLIVDEGQDYGLHLEVAGVDYPWENYKHFIVTNTNGTTGAMTSVDGSAHWNTDAADDGAPHDGSHANYAGFPDATRPHDARFPDGVYTIHVVVNDLIQSGGPFLEFPVRVENFPPFVCYSVPPHGAVLPAGSDVLPMAHVRFNEAMDTSVDPLTLVGVDNGAHIVSATWLGSSMLSFHIAGLMDGRTYRVVIDGALTRDLPGTPGHRPLDGNGDGIGGDSYGFLFSVAPGS